jgi:YD repeat-containing protein
MAFTKYIWDPLSDNVLMEKDENGNTKATNTYLPELHGELISQNRGGVESFHHYDGEGNTRALTDINGNVTDTYDYDAFGDVIASTGNTTNPLGYNGALGFYANPETNDY